MLPLTKNKGFIWVKEIGVKAKAPEAPKMESKPEDQCSLILAYLKKHGSITPMDAMTEFGCMRLGARIFDLKAEGHNIETTIETRVNEHGQRKRYARYVLCRDSSGT